MANEIEILVLRDVEGNTYALNAEMVRSAKVPADKVSTLKSEIQDADVAGYLFGPNFLNSFNVNAPTNTANLNQNQAQNAQNFGAAAGIFAFVGPQTATNVGVQGGTINQANA